ncbi:methyl-accepting chemotaxis protein [Sphingomonas trueperi]
MKIQIKILLLLAALGLVTLGVAWYGGKVLMDADGSYSELVGETLPDTVKLARANRTATEMVYAGYKAMAYDGSSATARAAADDEKAAYEKTTTLISDVIKAEPAKAVQLAEFRDLADKLHEQVGKAIAAGLRNDDEGARQALVLADGTVATFAKTMAQLNDGRIKAASDTSDALTASSSGLRLKLLISAVVALAGTMLLGAFLSKAQIANPLARLQDAMRALSSGNNGVDVPGSDRRDEVGGMAKSVLVFKEAAIEQSAAAKLKEQNDAAQKLVVDTLQDRLTRLAGGDLTATIDAHFSPEYDALKQNFNAAVDALRDLIAAVMDSAETISTGSAEIAQASEDLARRTEGAAASLEETSAAVTEMNSRIKATAASATQTVTRATAAIQVVGSGRSVADEAMQAMSRVSESAKGIDTVIEGLDKIAFQTRVLAMNAAVEAGRAGEAGRGFAVVADLVSALAMRAEEEAGRARDQLTATQTDINAAVDMVRRVDGALGDIVSDVNQVHGLLETMATDNQAQATTVTQVSTAVNSIDQMTQQNAAMVEQTSAAARNLNSEVSSLRERASRFQTGSGGNQQMARSSRTTASATASMMPKAPVASVRSVALGAEDWASF